MRIKTLAVLILLTLSPMLAWGWGVAFLSSSISADTTAPDFSSATIDGSTLVVTWTEACSQGVSYSDSHFDLDGAGSGTDVSITYQSGDGTAEWTFASGSAAVFGDSVNLDFDGTADSVEDAAGNDLAELTSETVTNNTAAAGGAPEYSGDSNTIEAAPVQNGTFNMNLTLDSNLSNGYVIAQYACYTTNDMSSNTATFDGTAMVLIHAREHATDGAMPTIVFGLAIGDKAAGTYTIELTTSYIEEVAAGAAAFNNVHQTSSIGTVASASGTSNAASCDVSSATGELVVGWLNYWGGTMSVGSGQTQIWSVDGGMDSIGSYEDGASTVTTSFSMSASHEWTVGGVGLKPLD